MYVMIETNNKLNPLFFMTPDWTPEDEQVLQGTYYSVAFGLQYYDCSENFKRSDDEFDKYVQKKLDIGSKVS